MSLPRMSWHIGDYKKDTGHLRAAGHGAYFLLSMHYWATGGLPNDDEQLATIACMTRREWSKHKPIIKPLFKAGEWKHKRIDEELTTAQAKYEKRAAAGKQGGNAKASAKQTPSNATAKPYQPITDNPKEKDGADAPPDPDADLFRRGKEVLGADAGSLIARLKKAKGGSIPHTRAVIEQASTKDNPREYVGRVMNGPARATTPEGLPFPEGIV